MPSAAPAAPAAPAVPGDTAEAGCASVVSIEGAFIPQGALHHGERAACSSLLHPIAGAEGSTVSVTLTAWGGAAPADLLVTDLLGGVRSSGEGLTSGGQVQVTLDRAGEFLVVLSPSDADELASGYALSVACVSGCARPYTRYPLVLMHGMGGTDAYLDLVTYYFGVADALSGAGYAVFTPAVDPYARSSVRSLDWAAHLEALSDAGEGRRFNLIGHSQGGLDARYVASLLDEEGRVATVTTIGTPHRGTPVADVLSGVLDVSWLAEVTAELLAEGLGVLLGAGGEQELTDSLDALGTGPMASFNDAVPDRDDVYYASWAGVTCGLLESDCVRELGGEVVDPFLSAAHLLLRGLGEEGDGIVPLSSAQWGDFQGVLPADHLDEVGQLLGVTADSFDHLGFYLGEAERLGGLGY